MTNCPNCGAPVTGSKCEYCGTVFDDNIDINYEIELKTDCLNEIIKEIINYSKVYNFESKIIR